MTYEVEPDDAELSFQLDSLWALVQTTDLDRLDEATVCKDKDAIRRAFNFGRTPPTPTEEASSILKVPQEQAPSCAPAVMEAVPPSLPSPQVAAKPASEQPPKRSFSSGVAVGCLVGIAIGSSLTYWFAVWRGEPVQLQGEPAQVGRQPFRLKKFSPEELATGRLTLAAAYLKDEAILRKFSPEEVKSLREGVETRNADKLPGGLLNRQFDHDYDPRYGRNGGTILSRQFDEVSVPGN